MFRFVMNCDEGEVKALDSLTCSGDAESCIRFSVSTVNNNNQDVQNVKVQLRPSQTIAELKRLLTEQTGNLHVAKEYEKMK